MDGPCAEPLFYGGRLAETEAASRVRDNPNRPGGNPLRAVMAARSRLEATYSGALQRDARQPRPVRPLRAGFSSSCGPCGGTGFVACATCACSGVYLEPTTQSAGVTNLVPCVDCGGSGDGLCPACAGRGGVAAA
jgi:hypothetical protein